jgi:hypothetical protein
MVKGTEESHYWIFVGVFTLGGLLFIAMLVTIIYLVFCNNLEAARDAIRYTRVPTELREIREINKSEKRD